MNVDFEKVSKYNDTELPIPSRATADSAGYDLYVAEDTVVPPYQFFMTKIQDKVFETKRHPDGDYYGFINPLTLDEMAALTKELKAKIPLVPTGMKCKLQPGQYLEISARSSIPLKHWLIVGNAIGIIDADYYNNPDNEGHIYFQIINLSPFAILLKKGDKIGQGIIHTYGVTDTDNACGERTGGFGSTTK